MPSSPKPTVSAGNNNRDKPNVTEGTKETLRDPHAGLRRCFGTALGTMATADFMKLADEITRAGIEAASDEEDLVALRAAQSAQCPHSELYKQLGDAAKRLEALLSQGTASK